MERVENLFHAIEKCNLKLLLAIFFLSVLSGCGFDNQFEKTKRDVENYFEGNSDATLAVKFLFADIKDQYGVETKYLSIDGSDMTREVFDKAEYLAYEEFVDSMNVQPSNFKIYDTLSLDSEFLVQNVTLALEVYQNPIGGRPRWYDWKIFSEYVLPYRVGVEVLNDWRPYFYNRYTSYLNTFNVSELKISEIASIVDAEIEGTSRYTFWLPTKIPQPSINQTMDEILTYRIPFSCEDYVIHSLYVLRSLGIPAAYEVIPYWGKFNFGHAQESIMLEDGKFHPNVRNETMPFLYQIAKMYRRTYSKVDNPIDVMIGYGEIRENIPPHFNYDNLIDITSERTEVSDITVTLAEVKNLKTIFLCVYNNGRWIPIDWAKLKNNAVKFTDIGRKMLYHIASYSASGVTLINDPFILTEGGDLTYLGSAKKKKIDFRVSKWDRQMIIETEQEYTIYTWSILSKSWRSLGKRPGKSFTEGFSLEVETDGDLFKIEPSSTSFINVRPFTITSGNQIWW